MNPLAQGLFWAAAFAVGYTYIGYPVLLWILSRLRPRPIRRAVITPPVTVIVTAYNEEASIGRKLDQLLEQDYPTDDLEIIVASDGSTDRTHEIVEGYADRGVRLLEVPGRVGKTATQNRAVQASSGEVLVFTDATTELADNAIRQIVCNFADPEVGCVAGHVSYVTRGGTNVGTGGKSYWEYERQVKQMESLINSITGATGCFYAVRKSAYRDIAPDLISDFVVALNTVQDGYRVTYDREAHTFEDTLEDPRREFWMRVRVAVRSYWALWAKRELLNPFRHGFFSLELLSHKVLRYCMPLFLLALLVLSLFLAANPIYAAIFALQALFYVAALTGHVLQRRSKIGRLLTKPYYFVLANLAALIAFLKFLRGERIVTWNPVR